VMELFADGETGLMVAPGSAEEFASAMKKLYQQPELRQRLGSHGRLKAMEKFDSSTGLHAWEHLYRELAPGRDGRHNS